MILVILLLFKNIIRGCMKLLDLEYIIIFYFQTLL